MTKNIDAKVARDVAAELLGDAPKPTKSERKAVAPALPSVKAVVESAIGKGKAAKAKVAKAKVAKAKVAKPKAAKPKAAKPKAAKPKAAKPKTSGNAVGRPSPYSDDQKIVVVKAREGRGQMQKLWDMVAKAKTVGAYKAAREKAGLEGLGGVFASFVKDGNIKVK